MNNNNTNYFFDFTNFLFQISIPGVIIGISIGLGISLYKYNIYKSKFIIKENYDITPYLNKYYYYDSKNDIQTFKNINNLELKNKLIDFKVNYYKFLDRVYNPPNIFSQSNTIKKNMTDLDFLFFPTYAERYYYESYYNIIKPVPETALNYMKLLKSGGLEAVYCNQSIEKGIWINKSLNLNSNIYLNNKVLSKPINIPHDQIPDNFLPLMNAEEKLIFLLKYFNDILPKGKYLNVIPKSFLNYFFEPIFPYLNFLDNYTVYIVYFLVFFIILKAIKNLIKIFIK